MIRIQSNFSNSMRDKSNGSKCTVGYHKSIQIDEFGSSFEPESNNQRRITLQTVTRTVEPHQSDLVDLVSPNGEVSIRDMIESTQPPTTDQLEYPENGRNEFNNKRRGYMYNPVTGKSERVIRKRQRKSSA